MNFLRTRPGARGFTLIELLVVIAIIAILAAILFPVFAQARAQARKINGTSMVRNVSTAILMYCQDYDEKFPRSGWSCSYPESSCNTTQWPNVVATYTKSAQIIEDPADTSKFSWDTFSNGRHTLLLNDLLSHHTTIGSDGFADFDNPPDVIKPQTPWSVSEVNSSSDCVMVTEGNCPWGNDVGAVDPATGMGYRDWTGKIVTKVGNKWLSEQSMSQYQAILITGTNYGGWTAFTGLPIHGEGTVYSYTDGHAKYAKVFDKGSAGKAPYYGNQMHGTLPFRKNYDPAQYNVNAANTLHLNGAGGSDNWH